MDVNEGADVMLKPLGRAVHATARSRTGALARPGDVVVWDNVAAHKVECVAQDITAAGGSIPYLPPYSPDLNSIKQLFAKLKALLRTAATHTKEALWSMIGSLIDTLSDGECATYLRNCGDGST